MRVSQREKQEQEQEPELYYGPPDKDRCCAYAYKIPGRRCPGQIDFYVKIPDGRGSDWRKAWAACVDHLPDVVYQMQQAHGQDGEPYGGEYLLRAADV